MLKAEASDPDGTIDSVEFRVNDVLVGIDYTAPYEMEYTAENAFRFTAVAIDNDGAVSLSEPVAVITSETNLIPDLEFTEPAANALFAVDSSITGSLTVKDFDGYIDSLVIMVNDSFLSRLDTLETRQVDFSFVAETSGNYTFKALAYDNENAMSKDSVIVRAGVLPEVSITDPIHNDSVDVNTTVTLTASATDADGSVASVEFLINNQPLDTIFTAPFELDWTPSSTGSYSVKAIATDNDGLIAGSALTTLHVVTITNTENVLKESNFSYAVYPNPVSDEITVNIQSADLAREGEIAIYNQLGAKVKVVEIRPGKTQENIHVDMNTLTNGIYFMQIRFNNHINFETIIKN
jgi:hypothetical protein